MCLLANLLSLKENDQRAFITSMHMGNALVAPLRDDKQRDRHRDLFAPKHKCSIFSACASWRQDKMILMLTGLEESQRTVRLIIVHSFHVLVNRSPDTCIDCFTRFSVNRSATVEPHLKTSNSDENQGLTARTIEIHLEML